MQVPRRTEARTLVLSNPNNPTGAVMGLAEITALAHELADLATVIVDESFIDFGDVPARPRSRPVRTTWWWSRAWARVRVAVAARQLGMNIVTQDSLHGQGRRVA
jgi:bifunctional pyridoxal-dependent enzyme with beta-cystathionase and maltose regulon repressor activities